MPEDRLETALSAKPALAIAAAMLLNVSLGSLHAFSMFLEPLERSFGATRAEVSLLYSLATACLTLSLLGGHHLHRRVQPAALAGLVGLVAAIGMAVAGAGASLPVVAFGYSVLFGTANGIGYGFSLYVAQQAQPQRKGAGVGAVTAAYAFGVVIFAELFAALTHLGGAGLAMLVMAGILLCAGIGAAGLLVLSRIGEMPPDRRHLRAGAADGRGWLILVLWTGYGLAAAAGLMALGHAAAIVAAKGARTELLAAGTMLIGVGNGIGGFAAGWLADRWTGRRLLIVFTILSAAMLVLLAYAAEPNVAIIALTAVGFAYGGIIAIYPIAVARYYPPDEAAKVFGWVFTAWGVAGVSAPWMAGMLFDVSGSYALALSLAAAAALLAAATATALPGEAPLRPSSG